MTTYSLDVLLSQFGTSLCCSMSSSNCCFLTCIQTSQEAGQVVWYSRLFQNFPQFVMIHTVKGFGIVSKAEIDIFPLVGPTYFHIAARVTYQKWSLATFLISYKRRSNSFSIVYRAFYDLVPAYFSSLTSPFRCFLLYALV